MCSKKKEKKNTKYEGKMRAGVLLQIYDSTELALSLAVGCRRHF